MVVSASTFSCSQISAQVHLLTVAWGEGAGWNLLSNIVLVRSGSPKLLDLTLLFALFFRVHGKLGFGAANASAA
jgi:hypothetical protein